VRSLESGRTVGGIPFTRGPLAHLLRNRFYIGEVVFKSEVLPGEQSAIIDRDLFDAVQAKLNDQRQNRTTARAKSDSLGCGHEGGGAKPRRVRATIENPSEKSHGVIIEGTFTTTADGILRVRDMQGRLYVERLAPGDEPVGACWCVVGQVKNREAICGSFFLVQAGAQLVSQPPAPGAGPPSVMDESLRLIESRVSRKARTMRIV
jgi:Recombinase